MEGAEYTGRVRSHLIWQRLVHGLTAPLLWVAAVLRRSSESAFEPQARTITRRPSIEFIVVALTIAALLGASPAVRAERDDEADLLPTLEEIQRLAPGWFDEVRSEGSAGGIAFRVFRGWREVQGAAGVEKGRVLLNITIRPRPDSSSPWGPNAWRRAFEQKQALVSRIPDLRVRQIDLGAFAYIVTRSGGSHVEVTFYTKDWIVTVHNGTDEPRLAYPAEAQALRIARVLAAKFSQGSPAR